jgi:hypothetical protein
VDQQLCSRGCLVIEINCGNSYTTIGDTKRFWNKVTICSSIIMLDVSHTMTVKLAGRLIFQQSDDGFIFDTGARGGQVGL